MDERTRNDAAPGDAERDAALDGRSSEAAPRDAPETLRADGRGAGEIFLVFLRLGLVGFGGPTAHLALFREALIRRRGWLDEAAYAELVAICQFLPGPASSQTGFALGLLRGGPRGALAAWLGFTAPSALLMASAAAGLGALGAGAEAGWLVGLKAAAVAVVAQAALGMGRSLAPDAPRQALAVGAAALALLAPGLWGQLGALALGAAAGLALAFGRAAGADAAPHAPLPAGLPRRAGALCLALFALLLAALPLLEGAGAQAGLASGVYRSGALVFGGGHVVLPLLEAESLARGWTSPEAFVAGYGAAQALPGPLFAFAAYLGWAAQGAAGALIATAAIFLPGLLLIAGALPFWSALRGRPRIRAALAGVNAAVVGLLLAALYDPVFVQGADGRGAFALAAAAWLALAAFRLSPVWTVLGAAALGEVMGRAGLLAAAG